MEHEFFKIVLDANEHLKDKDAKGLIIKEYGSFLKIRQHLT